MLDTLIHQPEAADLKARLRQLERENVELRRELARSSTETSTPRAARRQMPYLVASSGSWRECEFCGCNTNAEERLCCASGRSADRRSWDPA